MSVAEAEALFMARFNLSVMKDNRLEARPEEIKKQQADADRSMTKPLEEEEKAAGAPAAVSQKKKQAKTASTDCRGARLEQKEGGAEWYAGWCGSHIFPSNVSCSSLCRGSVTVYVQVWQLVGWRRGRRDRHGGRGW